MSTGSATLEEENLKLNICINCTNPVNVTVNIPSNKSIKCERCGVIVDKYIEFESCMVFLDCVLLSEIVFRHIIYNSKFKVIFEVFQSKCFNVVISDLQQNHNRTYSHWIVHSLETQVFAEGDNRFWSRGLHPRKGVLHLRSSSAPQQPSRLRFVDIGFRDHQIFWKL